MYLEDDKEILMADNDNDNDNNADTAPSTNYPTPRASSFAIENGTNQTKVSKGENAKGKKLNLLLDSKRLSLYAKSRP